MKRKKRVKVLLIESGAAMEMGIPPNIAVLVAALLQNDIIVNVFSTNDIKTI